MEPAIPLFPILKSVPMGTEFDSREERYRASIDDTKKMRELMDIMAGKIGEMMIAIKGNDMGTEGLVGQIKAIRMEQEAMKKRLDEIEVKAEQAKLEVAKKQFYLLVIWGLIGAVAATVFMTILNHFFPVLKHI